MFYAGNPTQGVCPKDKQAHDGSHSLPYVAVLGDAGVVHDGSASAHYAMPWDLPEILHVHGDVTFPSPTALGGWFDLALTSHGDTSFSGHLHDSGLDSYDETIVVVLMTPDGLAYSVTHQGTTHGTFDPGSRDDDWATNAQSPLVAANWDNQFALANWRWSAHAGSLIGQDLTNFISSTAQQLAASLGKAAVGAVTALI